MRGLLPSLMLTALIFSGCLDGDSTDPAAKNDDSIEPADPYHVDEMLDLSSGADKSWEWTMTEGMTGDVSLTFTPDPLSIQGPDRVCWRIEWPEGAHWGGTNCGQGNVGNVVVQFSGTSTTQSSTIYSNYLIPNEFTLRVWTSAPDTAQVRVVVDTYAAPAP